jgi:hypothetical protein
LCRFILRLGSEIKIKYNIFYDRSHEPLITSHSMNFDKLYSAINAGLPYFGEEVLGVQSNPGRHGHMKDLFRQICSERNHQSKKILEIGSWIGTSVITWAHAIQLYNGGSGPFFCIDPWEPSKLNRL